MESMNFKTRRVLRSKQRWSLLPLCSLLALLPLVFSYFHSGGESKPRVELFVSFWAPSNSGSPHRNEVLAAILMNMRHPYISSVHIALEARPDFGCKEFSRSLEEPLAQMKKQQSTAKLVCVPYEAQPTYLQMFQFTQTAARGNIAVLMNGDMVFDASLAQLRRLRHGTAAVVATSGLAQAPKHVLQIFSELHDIDSKNLSGIPNRCYDPQVLERTSWDAFAWYAHEIVIEEKFFIDANTGLPFYMNQNGAENAALHALQQSNSGLNTLQSCDIIKMWHLHTEEKMHHNGSEEFVGAPRAAPHFGYKSRCRSIKEC